MSWPLWNQGVASGVVDLNAAAAAGYSGYTPEQWAALQQQNWQQWSQWQEQYTQWQMQYGDKYAEQLKNTNVSFGSQPPLPSIVPSKPPPPPPGGPPPPPDGPPPPPKDNKMSQNSSANLYANSYPSQFGMVSQFTQNMQVPPPGNFGQASTSSYQNNYNSNNISKRTSDSNYNKYSQNEQWNDNNKKQNNFNRSRNNTMQSNKPDTKPSQTKTEQEMNEEERLFDEQFKKWEEDFLIWKEQNANHPDKNAYREYEQKFEACRVQLIERKEQMRIRRVAAAAKASKSSVQEQQDEESKQSYPQDNNSQDDQQFSNQYKHLDSVNASNENSYASYVEDQNSSDLFPNIADRKGIPGLDLVENEPENKDNGDDVIELDREEETRSNRPDLLAISRGINSILGDEKLLHMISLVRSNAGTQDAGRTSRWSNQDDTSNQTPSISNNMSLPQNLPSIPSLMSVPLHSGVPTTNTWGNMPPGMVNIPSGMGNMPSGMGNMPSGMGNMPSGMGNMPSGMGNMPSGMGSMPPGMGIMGTPGGMPNMQGIGMNNAQTSMINNMQGLRQGNLQGSGMGDMHGAGINNMRGRNVGNNNQAHGFNSMNSMQGSGGDMMNMQQNPGMGTQRNFRGPGLGDMPARNARAPMENFRGPDQDMYEPMMGNMQDRRMGNFQGNMNRDGGMDNMRKGMNNMQQTGNMPFRANNNNMGNMQQDPMGFKGGPQSRRNNDNMYQNQDPEDPQDPYYDQYYDEENVRDTYGDNRVRRQDMFSNDRNPNFAPSLGAVGENVSNKPEEEPAWLDVPLIEPVTIVDYQHLPRKIPNEFHEPAQIFDYNHESKVDKVKKPSVDPTFVELDTYHIRTGATVIDYQNKSTTEFGKRASPVREPSVEFVSATYDGRSREERYERLRREERYERNREEREYLRSERYREDKDSMRNRDMWDDREDRRDGLRDECRDTEWEDRSRDLLREERIRGFDERNRDRNNWTDDRGSRRDRPSRFERRSISAERTLSQSHPAYESTNEPSDSMEIERVPQGKNIVMIDDLLESPGREMRPERIVIILRGLPGSGKSYLAKLIKEKEQENGGTSLRILSIDDYFVTEVDSETTNADTGRKEKVKEMKYEYDESMESMYITSLIKSFKKTLSDGFFSFIIVDAVNNNYSHVNEIASFAKFKRFVTYICEMENDVHTCFRRNIHNRTLKDIEDLYSKWDPTPPHCAMLDTTTLLQSAAIDDVHMEDVCDDDDDLPEVGEDQPEDEVKLTPFSSKWDRMDDKDIAKLDGTSKPLRHTASMEDYLQLDEWTEKKTTQPGKKTVRWADIEERREQEKMRAIGFVVGQTDWQRMTDPTQGSGALTKTKYIERVRRN